MTEDDKREKLSLNDQNFVYCQTIFDILVGGFLIGGF